MPEAPGSAEGHYHRLTPSSSLPDQGFLVIPYNHPRHGINAQYYSSAEAEQLTLVVDESAQTAPVLFRPAFSKAEYIDKVGKLKKHIARGDIYEINFCMEFIADNVQIDPLKVFSRLSQIGKAPFNFLVRLADDYILCVSPELFLRKEGRTLISKPIKGTARRGADQAEDKALRDQLYHSLKERTENVMAVDVARNDLSMLATRGSVEVNKLYNIETFETVHQMVSTVSCQLREDLTFDQILKATFPMASMTGAPKRSAMNLIESHETFSRHFYSGAIGLCGQGDFELAVVIRSLFYNTKSQRLSFATGGAITYLSDPEQEYEECLLKARSMLKASNGSLQTL